MLSCRQYLTGDGPKFDRTGAKLILNPRPFSEDIPFNLRYVPLIYRARGIIRKLCFYGCSPIHQISPVHRSKSRNLGYSEAIDQSRRLPPRRDRTLIEKGCFTQ